MLHYTVNPHSSRRGVEMVEVRSDEGDLIATIVQGDDDEELRVISKYMHGVNFLAMDFPTADGVTVMEGGMARVTVEWWGR